MNKEFGLEAFTTRLEKTNRLSKYSQWILKQPDEVLLGVVCETDEELNFAAEMRYLLQASLPDIILYNDVTWAFSIATLASRAEFYGRHWGQLFADRIQSRCLIIPVEYKEKEIWWSAWKELPF